MAIVFKKALRKNVADQTAAAKYYPQLLTLGQSVGIDKIAYQMKENSSLSKGDILSVIANFVECMRKNLYNGHSVNIRDFGVFSLSARTEGSETEKDCTDSAHQLPPFDRRAPRFGLYTRRRRNGVRGSANLPERAERRGGCRRQRAGRRRGAGPVGMMRICGYEQKERSER